VGGREEVVSHSYSPSLVPFRPRGRLGGAGESHFKIKRHGAHVVVWNAQHPSEVHVVWMESIWGSPPSGMGAYGVSRDELRG
jgi:hypothetical protein